MWVCSLSYWACSVHALYYIFICDLSGCTIFFHIISWMAQFPEKKLLNIKCLFWFHLQRLCEMFLILRRIEWDIVMNVRYIHLHVKYPLFWKILMKFEFSWQIFKKYMNVKFHKNPSIWSWVPCGRIDRQTWWSYYSHFAILQTCLKTAELLNSSSENDFWVSVVSWRLVWSGVWLSVKIALYRIAFRCNNLVNKVCCC